MNYLEILKQYWGYESFRGIQREIIESIGNGKDTLGLMPTGGGKSITFQVPAIAKEGVCIVITPLIALMKDQVANLRSRGVRAAALYSGMSRDEIIVTLENCIFGGVKILYVSPERLSSELFQKKLSHMKVCFITVDEAHCISQWGYDFRPSYLEIAKIRSIKPDVPVLALTATATPQVTDDIQEKLGFKEKNLFRMSFERKNLAYIVRKTADKENELVNILSNEISGSAIVYVRSRRRSKEIAELLVKCNISATFYNAGLDNAVKDERQKEWTRGAVRVMVATNAFGMGIDKPDVRCVVHVDCPDSPEAYFQEAGRAGRDGKKSIAVLLYNDSDERKLERRVNDNFPEKEYIKEIYEHLAYFYQIAVGSGNGTSHEFNIDKFCHTFKHFPVPVDSALRILTRSGYLDYDCDSDNNARLMFLLSRNELYRLDSLSENETNVITTLLRGYGGLFTDYCFIDEAFIAQQAGLNKQQVYMILKNLSDKHIIHFIPQKKMPRIRYTQRREEMERLIIPPSVYEERKEQYKKRIKAMLDYAKEEKICRSRLLLYYFGEKKSKDCGQCDVCVEHPEYNGENLPEKAKEYIKQLLSDGKPHNITELKKAQMAFAAIDEALEIMLEEEEIMIEYNKIMWTKKLA